MKNDLFITHPAIPPVKFREGWLSFFNNRSLPLERGEGILNVKKELRLTSALKKAVIRCTALGVYRLYVGGVRVGRDELTPGWTDYQHRVLSQEYDITGLLQNSGLILAEVGPGWWRSLISYGTYGFKSCAFAAEITLEYADGTRETIQTDESWDAMVGGPCRTSDIWDGQYYDDTLPHPARQPEFYRWDKAVIFREFGGQIQAGEAPAVRVREKLSLLPQTAFVYEGTEPNGTDFGAVKILRRSLGRGCEKTELKKGQSLVLDFGQEMVGWPALTLQGCRGAEVEVFFAELLNDSGLRSRGNDGPKDSPYLENYRATLARYVVKLGDEKIVTHIPYFTFYGFRYIEIRATEDVTLLAVEGQVLGSDLEETGTFSCDNPEVNRLYQNILWGMRGNYLSIPTDCPQRNERLGWTGDTQIFSGAASYLADIRAFMHSWLADCRNSQIGYEGAYADVVPRSLVTGPGGSGAWGDAGLIVPYRLYLMYNDTAILREHYDSMEWYMEYLTRNGLKGPKPVYGDWLNYDETDKEYVSVCYYAYDLALMALFSRILGKEDRAAHYEALRTQVVDFWRDTYIREGQLTVNTQTGYLLPLGFDMVPKELEGSFRARLRGLIEGNDHTLSTGFVGTGLLCQTLDKLGMADLCYSLLLQTRDPSWLYSVRQGATTVWERWNSYTLERGFGDVIMNSFNHYSYGAVAEWFYSGICGICPVEEAPGFARFLLKPTPDLRTVLPEGQNRIRQAKATYRSCRGTIESGWAEVNGAWEYDFVIPEGTTAQVRLISSGHLTFNGMEVSPEELKATREDGRLVFDLGPGSYHIRTR